MMGQLAADPAARKGSTMEELLAFNRRLAAPGTATFGQPKATFVAPPRSGDFVGNPDIADAILKKYQTPGTYAGYSNLPARPIGTPLAAGFPLSPAGASGPTGEPSDSYHVAPPGSIPPQGMGDSPSPGQTIIGMGQAAGDALIQQGQGNAMQRHQEEAQTDPAMRPISAARRFFWATGRIDGSAPLSPRSALTNFDSTFGSGASHMGAPGVTWEQRQQQNQQHIADASAQRGLDFSPY